MTLDKLLGNLTKTENGKRNVNPIYVSEFLTGATNKLLELEKLDITTTNGLNAYSALTGDDPTKHSQKIAELRKQARLIGGQADLSNYVDKHFNKIIEELDETTQINVGFQYCPEKNIEGNHKPYNTVRTIVTNTKEELQAIKEDPEKYINNILKKESPIMIHYITRFTDEFLNIKQEEAKRNSALAIAHYDAGKFLRMTKQHFDTQNKAIQKEQEDFETTIKTKIEMAEKNKGRILSIAETIDLISDKRKKLQNAYEKNSDASMLEPFILNTVSLAIEAIKKNQQSN